MNSLLSRSETYFKYNVLNSTILEISTILYKKFGDVNYMNNNDGPNNYMFSSVTYFNSNL